MGLKAARPGAGVDRPLAPLLQTDQIPGEVGGGSVLSEGSLSLQGNAC